MGQNVPKRIVPNGTLGQKRSKKECQKKVKEIFSDYQAKANIIDAEVEGLNVNKKTNTLGITIKLDEYIEVKEIWYFEKFLIERFAFKNIDMSVQYTEDVKVKSVKEEWRNIICYMHINTH